MGACKNNQRHTRNQQDDNRKTASLITNHGFILRRGEVSRSRVFFL